MRCVVLLSGGLDSYTAAAIARSEGFSLYALTLKYGQRHAHELIAARRVAESLGVARHLELPLDLRGIGGSALTSDVSVPRDRDLTSTDIPSTYVPARNTIFLAIALGWAETLDARDVFIGVNALDYSSLATRAGVEGARFQIHTPLITLSKADIIRRGLALKLDYGLTHSCYDPGEQGQPCGHCDSCLLRAKGFAEAGAEDPLTLR
jgi:7-cyano-7-deazaguanine synthase